MNALVDAVNTAGLVGALVLMLGFPVLLLVAVVVR